MRQEDRIFVAGHRGFVGAAVLRRLRQAGHDNLVLAGHDELDLTAERAVAEFFAAHRPQVVILAAARTGGPLATATYPVDFLLDNLRIQNNVIDAAWRHRARKLVFVAAPCVYPTQAPQPLGESALLTAPLDARHESEALAKIAGIRLCQAYRRQYGFDAVSVVPATSYGPGMDFDPLAQRLLPSLIRRIHEAHARGVAEVMLPFHGPARHEFLHVDDLADAVLHLARSDRGEQVVNIGTGEDISLRGLAELVRDAAGYTGRIATDPAAVDALAGRRLDIARLRRLGWHARTPLREGIAQTYAWFLAHEAGQHR